MVFNPFAPVDPLVYKFYMEKSNENVLFTCLDKTLTITVTSNGNEPMMIIDEDEIDHEEIHGFGKIIHRIEEFPPEWGRDVRTQIIGTLYEIL
jgi:hypothetical protein